MGPSGGGEDVPTGCRLARGGNATAASTAVGRGIYQPPHDGHRLQDKDIQDLHGILTMAGALHSCVLVGTRPIPGTEPGGRNGAAS